MHIRIISGKYKGRRISAPKHLPIRPTTDRAKEALFNILNNYVYFPELKVLDLFTGSGSIAYEFASRGSKDIQAVDRNFSVVKFVNQIAKDFEFPIKTIKKDGVKFLEKTTDKYDIIFADPPYDIDKSIMNRMIEVIIERKLILPEGFFILEHIEQVDFSEQPNFLFARKYGLAVFSFFSSEKQNIDTED